MSREKNKLIDKNQIRQRKSYRKFRDILDKYNAMLPMTEAQLADFIYKLLDEHSAFKSRTNARSAKESLDLLLEDRRIS